LIADCETKRPKRPKRNDSRQEICALRAARRSRLGPHRPPYVTFLDEPSPACGARALLTHSLVVVVAPRPLEPALATAPATAFNSTADGDDAAADRLLLSVRNPVALPGPTPPSTVVVFNYGPAAKDEELTVFCTLSNAGCRADPLTNVATASMSAGDTGACVLDQLLQRLSSSLTPSSFSCWPLPGLLSRWLPQSTACRSTVSSW